MDVHWFSCKDFRNKISSEGVSYPIMPSQLLFGRNVMLTPNDSHLEVVSTQELLAKRAKHHRKLLADFGKRWMNEYLIGLRKVATVYLRI